MRVLKTAAGEVRDVAFSPDGRAVAAAVEYAGVFLWNLDSPTIAPVRLDDERFYFGGLCFSANGRRVFWRVRGRGRVRPRRPLDRARSRARPRW